VTDVIKEIGRLWRLLSKQEKLKYKLLAKEDKERYEQEISQILKESDQYEKPKKPLTTYMFFVREMRNKVKKEFPGIPALDIMKEVGKKWSTIEKSDLQRFEELSKKDLERYQKEHASFIKKINDKRMNKFK